MGNREWWGQEQVGLCTYIAVRGNWKTGSVFSQAPLFPFYLQACWSSLICHLSNLIQWYKQASQLNPLQPGFSNPYIFVDGSVGLAAVLPIPPNPLNGNLGGVIASDYAPNRLAAYFSQLVSSELDFTLIANDTGAIIATTLPQPTAGVGCLNSLKKVADIPSTASAAEPLITRFSPIVGNNFYQVSTGGLIFPFSCTQYCLSTVRLVWRSIRRLRCTLSRQTCTNFRLFRT